MSFYIPPETQWIRPQDPMIKIETHPAKDVAVLRFSGIQSLEVMERSKGKLLELVKERGLLRSQKFGGHSLISRSLCP